MSSRSPESIQLTAEPFDGGAGGGLFTNWVPIFAQAVVGVEEAQNFTWEWLGITAPGTMELEGFPNLTLAAISADTVEYSELGMDLNPISANKWGSAEIILLPYDELHVSGRYGSFSTETDFEAEYGSSHFAFAAQVESVDYSRFPEELTARVERHVGQGVLRPSQQVVLEPKLRLGQLTVQMFYARPGARPKSNRIFTLHHTPTGDANNDGKISFDDFLILSRGFGIAEAARWEDGDFDGDGAVGFGDFLGLSRNFGTGPSQSVPEPAGWMMIGLGGALLSATRRRRRWDAAE